MCHGRLGFRVCLGLKVGLYAGSTIALRSSGFTKLQRDSIHGKS